jgi:peroxiredoxin
MAIKTSGLIFIFVFIFNTAMTYSADLDALISRAGLTAVSKETVNLTLENLEGQKINLSDYKGKVVFLNFWTTWSLPCRSQMLSMEQLYQQLKDKDFIVLAVDLRESQSIVKGFVQDKNLHFPILLDSKGSTGNTCNIWVIPTTFILNKDGKIIAKNIGAKNWATKESINLIEALIKEE